MLRKHILPLIFLLVLGSMAVYWGTHRISICMEEQRQRNELDDVSNKLLATVDAWERGPNGERWFPLDSVRFGRPISENGDGTYRVEDTPYFYRPLTRDGQRVANDPADGSTIVLWDPGPFREGKFIVVTAGFGMLEATEEEIATGRIARD